MEPIRLWRFALPATMSGRKYPSPMHYEDGDPLHRDDEGHTERFIALPRADYDAMVKERDEAVKERNALRGEVATLRGARSADDVCEMLCEASCVDVTPERCARIWSLLEHPATTMTTLAVIADERGESYANAAAERDAALKQRDEARAMLKEARAWVHDGVMGRFTPRSCAPTVLARIDKHLEGA